MKISSQHSGKLESEIILRENKRQSLREKLRKNNTSKKRSIRREKNKPT